MLSICKDMDNLYVVMLPATHSIGYSRSNYMHNYLFDTVGKRFLDSRAVYPGRQCIQAGSADVPVAYLRTGQL